MAEPAGWTTTATSGPGSFDRKAEAQAHIAEVTGKLATGAYADPRRSAETFGTVADQWLASKATLKPKTYAGYEISLGDADPAQVAGRDRCGTSTTPGYRSGSRGFPPTPKRASAARTKVACPPPA